MIRIALGAAGLLSFVLSAVPADATTFVVSPGPGPPLQDAIDAAAPGHTIRLPPGTFNEHIVISKSLRLRGVEGITSKSDRLTALNGNCTAGPLVSITADGVQVRDVALNEWVDGGLDVVGRNHIKLKSVFSIANCASTITAPAFNIESCTLVTLDHIWGTGFADQPAGIRIADTPQDGRVKLRKSIAGGADNTPAGILLENDGINAVRVSSNFAYGSLRGIFLVGTSRAIVDHNKIGANSQSGLEIDAGSSGNLLIANFFDSGNGVDVVDNGAGNCWKNNTYSTGTVPPCP